MLPAMANNGKTEEGQRIRLLPVDSEMELADILSARKKDPGADKHIILHAFGAQMCEAERAFQVLASIGWCFQKQACDNGV